MDLVLISIGIALIHYIIDYFLFKNKKIPAIKFLVVNILIIVVFSSIFSFIFDKLYYTPSSLSIYLLCIVLCIGFIIILCLLTLIRTVRKKVNHEISKIILCLILFIIYLFIYNYITVLLYNASNSFVRNNYLFEVRSWNSNHAHSNIVFIYKDGTVKVLEDTYGYISVTTKLSNKYDYESILNTIKEARDDFNSEDSKQSKDVSNSEETKQETFDPMSVSLAFNTYHGYSIRLNGEKESKVLYSGYIEKYNLEEFFGEISKYTNKNLFLK